MNFLLIIMLRCFHRCRPKSRTLKADSQNGQNDSWRNLKKETGEIHEKKISRIDFFSEFWFFLISAFWDFDVSGFLFFEMLVYSGFWPIHDFNPFGILFIRNYNPFGIFLAFEILAIRNFDPFGILPFEILVFEFLALGIITETDFHT